MGENAEIATRAIDVVLRRSLEEAYRLCAEDVRLRTLYDDPAAPDVDGHQGLEGREGLRLWFERLDGLWAFVHVQELEAVEHDRGWVLLRLKARARGRGSPQEVTLRIAVAIQVVDGLVASAGLYTDEAEAMAVIDGG